MSCCYFLSNILLENTVNRVPFVLLVSRIVDRNFQPGIWKPCIQKTWQQAVVLLDNVRTFAVGSHQNLTQIFLLKLRLKRKLSLKQTVVTVKPVLCKLHNIDRNSHEWHQVLDLDNDEPSFTRNFSPLGTPGPINCIPSTIEYVIMLLGDEFIDLLVEETNRYGDIKQLSKSDDENMNPRRKKWKHTTREEFLAFLGIVTSMGLIRKGSMKEYWNKTDWSQDTPSFSIVFTRDRFFQLQVAVHFPQIEGDSSKLQKVQAIVQHCSQQFQEYYVPEQQVSTDESLIGFEVRGPAIQYMSNKHHHRFGFKLFCLCESSTGYTFSFSIYEGKNKNFSEHGLSHDICVDLMEPLLDMGYHLYTDNWYTAIPLAEFLSSRNTNITGTVRATQKFLPAGVKQKLPKGDSVAFRKNNLLCIGWHEKKHVILLSTEGSSKMITYTSK